ncbi:IS5 family transposase [Patescibacteria group bacterium]|nr:IS5 family transposase [Patescibacteria group bacterium]
MNQPSFLSIAHHKKLKCERFLDEMRVVVPWDAFMEKIEPLYVQKHTGRKRIDALRLLKIYFLQQWYTLSDPGAEEAIYDRNSFQKFLQIDLLADSVPDETSILNFRHFLEEHGLQEIFFETVRQILEDRRLLMKNGTIVDATIIEAPSSTKNEDKKRDPDMSSTKKGGQWYFGMKGHIGVDAQSGLVHSVETSTAKVHDKEKMADLFHGEEKSKFGDKGYVGDKEKREARKSGIFWGILDKGRINHPLSSSQKKRNRKLSSIRSKVEHPFQIIKCQWGYVKVRYRGLKKNTAHLYTLFMLANIFKIRHKLRFAT